MYNKTAQNPIVYCPFNKRFLELSINEFIYTLTSLGAAAVNIQEYGKPVNEI